MENWRKHTKEDRIKAVYDRYQPSLQSTVTSDLSGLSISAPAADVDVVSVARRVLGHTPAAKSDAVQAERWHAEARPFTRRQHLQCVEQASRADDAACSHLHALDEHVDGDPLAPWPTGST